ncbi:MAG: helix-turn-helix transcriptional regulator, partial [Thermoanaerobaculia bacterium]|nr:helix-turn-helix transcriptional regulator [Thermoanaerobaculia bacterium]
MKIPQRKHLGELEHLVLLAVARLEGEAYGAAIQRLLGERADRRVAIGALYRTLDRLVDKGYLETRRGEPEPERGGRPKRYFSLTAGGHRAL